MILAEEKNIRKGEKNKKLTTANPSRSKQENMAVKEETGQIKD